VNEGPELQPYDSLIVVNVWYFLYMEFKRSLAPYLLWHVLRQLMLSIVLILIPREESMGLLSLLLISLVAVQLWQMPYRLVMHNFLESVVLVAIVLNLLIGFTSSTEDESDETLNAVIMIGLQVAVLGVCIYAAVVHTKFRELPRRRCTWPLARFLLPVHPVLERTSVDQIASPDSPTALAGSDNETPQNRHRSSAYQDTNDSGDLPAEAPHSPLAE
jgi:hypothetical protein